MFDAHPEQTENTERATGCIYDNFDGIAIRRSDREANNGGCTERYETRGQSEHTMFCQPGMRYSIAKALVYSLMQDEYFSMRPESEKTYIAEKILEDVKGRMLEDVVLLEASMAAPRNQEIFKFKFDNGGEYDMVIYDKDTDSCRLYEVKHSDKIDTRQTRYLRDEDKIATVSHRFGTVAGKYVLYCGQTQVIEGVKYQNVEEYLKNL